MTSQVTDDELRPGPGDHSINVCFSTTSGWFSGIIRWATGSDVSHALITFHSLSFRKVMVLEAVGKGYRMVPWKAWSSHNKLVARYRIDTETVPLTQQCAALEQMANHLGEGYDVRGLFGFVKLLWRSSAKRIRNRAQDPNQLFCSEAVALFLQRAGMNGFDHPADWTPARLFQHVAEQPDLFVRQEPLPEAQRTGSAGEQSSKIAS